MKTAPLSGVLRLYPFFFPAVASHSGAAMVSLKFLNMRLNEMLMRSLWPSLAGTVCFSQAAG